MSKFKFILPMPYKSQLQNRKSDALMTLNVHRNLHYRSQAHFKLVYGEKLAKQLPKNHPAVKAAKLTYTLHIQPTTGKPTKREPYRNSHPKNIDLSNVLSLVDKVFADELVKANILPDDSIRHVQEVTFKVNPWASKDFIEVTLEETTPLTDPRLNI